MVTVRKFSLAFGWTVEKFYDRPKVKIYNERKLIHIYCY
jgi:hypothetical protein